ncbi:unnamed protein product, partial [marine sediment metagenome]
IILALLGLMGILNLGDTDIVLFLILIISGSFSIVSGAFHLEKS